MLTIGVTGNIGSGKTTVCKIFSSLGIPVYDADSEAKHLMSSDEELKKQLKIEFSEKVFDENNQLDKNFLAGKVFSDKNELLRLNKIVHPAVRKDFQTWLSKISDVPYLIKEAAILFESGANEDCNYTVVVTSPLDLRSKRVTLRDAVPEEQFLKRENSQLREEEKQKLADFEIINDENHLVIQQVLKLHEHFLSLTRK